MTRASTEEKIEDGDVEIGEEITSLIEKDVDKWAIMLNKDGVKSEDKSSVVRASYGLFLLLIKKHPELFEPNLY
jgi:hypothetical protein